MAWIESNQELGRHPKTKKLARLLGVNVREAVGTLHFLWWWALDFAHDGNLDRYEAEDIADAVLWDEDADKLFNALIEAGFIDNDNGSFTIHDWDEYAGKLFDKREKDRQRKQKSSSNYSNSNGSRSDSNGSPTEVQRNSNGSRSDSAVTLHNHTLPNITVPDIYTPKSPQGEITTETETVSQDTDITDKAKVSRSRTTSVMSKAHERRFAQFWDSYPRKVAKGAAEKAWLKISPDDSLTETILGAVKMAIERDHRFREQSFIPHPATWLNAREWENKYTDEGGINSESIRNNQGNTGWRNDTFV